MNDKGEQQNKTCFQRGLVNYLEYRTKFLFSPVHVLIQLSINHKQFQAENTNVMASKNAKLLPKHGSGIKVSAFIQSRKLSLFRIAL